MTEEDQLPRSRLSNQSKKSLLPKSLSQDRLPTAGDNNSQKIENPADVYQTEQ